MNSNRQIKYGALLSYIQIGLNVIINLLYTPFLIRMMGKSDYGLYNTVSSVISSLSILNLGFGSSYVRYYSQYREKKDINGISRLNGLFIIVFSIMGFVALVCGFLLSFNLRLVFSNGLTSDELSTARILMILLAINLAISFPASVFTSIITAHEGFIFQKSVLILRHIAVPLLSIPVLKAGSGSVGLVLVTLSVSVISDVAYLFFVIQKLNCKFVFRSLDRNLLKSIAVFSSFIAVNMIVDQINTNVDKFLLGRYCGTTHVAIYSVGFTLYNYYHVFSTAISNVVIPRIHRIWNDNTLSIENKNSLLSKMFANIGRIQLLILLLVSSGLCFFGRGFIALWVGEGFEKAYYVSIILSISAIVPLTQNIGIEIQRAKNKHKFRSVLYGIMACINLAISIVLCQKYAEIGCVIGTAIANIVANTILMDFYYYKYLCVEIILYWRFFFRTIFAAIPAFICCFTLLKKWDVNSYPTLVVPVILYSIVYIGFEFLFGTSRVEKVLIYKTIQKVMKNK